jgi:hypothetical protein
MDDEDDHVGKKKVNKVLASKIHVPKIMKVIQPKKTKPKRKTEKKMHKPINKIIVDDNHNNFDMMIPMKPKTMNQLILTFGKDKKLGVAKPVVQPSQVSTIMQPTKKRQSKMIDVDDTTQKKKRKTSTKRNIKNQQKKEQEEIDSMVPDVSPEEYKIPRIKIIPITLAIANNNKRLDPRIGMPHTFGTNVARLLSIRLTESASYLMFDDSTDIVTFEWDRITFEQHTFIQPHQYYRYYFSKQSGYLRIEGIKILEDPNEMTFFYLTALQYQLPSTPTAASTLEGEEHDLIYRNKYHESISSFKG